MVIDKIIPIMKTIVFKYHADEDLIYEFRAKLLTGELKIKEVDGISKTAVTLQKFKNFIIDEKRRKKRKMRLASTESNKSQHMLVEILEELTKKEKILIIADLLKKYSAKASKKNEKFTFKVDDMSDLNKYILDEFDCEGQSYSDFYTQLKMTPKQISRFRKKTYAKIREMKLTEDDKSINYSVSKDDLVNLTII